MIDTQMQPNKVNIFSKEDFKAFCKPLLAQEMDVPDRFVMNKLVRSDQRTMLEVYGKGYRTSLDQRTKCLLNTFYKGMFEELMKEAFGTSLIVGAVYATVLSGKSLISERNRTRDNSDSNILAEFFWCEGQWYWPLMDHYVLPEGKTFVILTLSNKHDLRVFHWSEHHNDAGKGLISTK